MIVGTTRMALACFLAAIVAGSTAVSGQELARRATWAYPDPISVRDALAQWLDDSVSDETTKQRLMQPWQADDDLPEGPALLDRLVDTIALVLPEARDLRSFCLGRHEDGPVPEFPVLLDEKLPPLVRHQLRLYFGRWLVQHGYYDEALVVLEELQPEDVVDPGSLLFYQAAAYHRLLKKKPGLETIERLLENEAEVPHRYVALARLMEADLRPLQVDSLDEVARLMDDISRRLDLGRAGRRVRDEEEQVIAKLDKMIKKLEQQMQQASASSQSSQNQSSRPADDSRPLGGKGPGEVEKKSFREDEEWGNLPPKAREEALQQISKDLPAHFRTLIEEYFRKLAREQSGAGGE